MIFGRPTNGRGPAAIRPSASQSVKTSVAPETREAHLLKEVGLSWALRTPKASVLCLYHRIRRGPSSQALPFISMHGHSGRFKLPTCGGLLFVWSSDPATTGMTVEPLSCPAPERETLRMMQGQPPAELRGPVDWELPSSASFLPARAHSEDQPL